MEWRNAEEEFEENAANRPPIASLVLLVASNRFWCQIIRSSDESAVRILGIEEGHSRGHHAGLWERWVSCLDINADPRIGKVSLQLGGALYHDFIIQRQLGIGRL